MKTIITLGTYNNCLEGVFRISLVNIDIYDLLKQACNFKVFFNILYLINNFFHYKNITQNLKIGKFCKYFLNY